MQPPEKVAAVLEYLENCSNPCAARRIRIGPDGEIVERAAGEPLYFGFSYYGIEVHAVASEDASGGRLRLDANFGRIPHTAEATEVHQRVMELVQTQTHLLTSIGREVGFKGEIGVTLPLTPVNIISAAAGFMLEVKPEIEQLASCLPTADTVA
jgi:hypothetical protein